MPERADHVDVSAPATPEMMDVAHDAIERLWSIHDDVSMADRIRFETAVMEILGNIVEHAYALDESSSPETRRFDLTLTVDAATVVAAFGDDGLPVALDLSSVVMPGEDAESGRGLALAMAAVDDLSYERQGGRNHWRLTVNRR